MEKGKEGDGTNIDGLRDWLLQLEKRVSELEHERELVRRRRRRGFWLVALIVVLYLLSIYWVTNLL